MVSKLNTERCASKDIGTKGVNCEILHRLERGSLKRKTQYILVVGLGALQMVSEPDTERCASDGQGGGL